MMSRTPKLAAVAVLAAFSGLALQVQAQETVELDEVKVTAGRRGTGTYGREYVCLCDYAGGNSSFKGEKYW